MHRKVLLISTLLVASPALAGGPYPAISGISAAADDASVAGTNPAAMTRFDERKMKFEVLGFYSDNTWEGQVGEDGREFKSQDSNTTVVPSANMIMPVRDNLWFGWTVLGSGYSDDYEDGWPGRYFIEEYDMLYISAFPSLAMKVNEKFSVAASYSRPVAERWRVGVGGFITNDMIEDDQRTLTLRLDRIWSIGAGVEWQWRDDRRVSATLNYLKIGDAPVTSPEIGGIGSVTGRFTDRGTIYLRVGLALGS